MRPIRLLCLLALSGFALVATGGRIDSLDTPQVELLYPPTPFNGVIEEPDSPLSPEVEQWRPLVAEIFPADEVDDVLSVMACESRGNPNTRYLEEWGVDSVGLMQINGGWLTGWSRPEWAIRSHNGQPVDLTDPGENLRAAKFIRYFEDATEQKPWSQWACKPKNRI